MPLEVDKINQKILTLSGLKKVSTAWCAQQERVVFTNGCFDVLHHGHVEYLAKSADKGDRLVVGVNSDYSVKQLNKAPERPINMANSRAFLIAALSFVDAVVVFDEITPYNLIKQLNPQVLVKGADYDANEMDPNSSKYIVGSDLIRKKGGEIHTIELKKGYSTSQIINKIKRGN